jgi:hypothetical protein
MGKASAGPSEPARTVTLGDLATLVAILAGGETETERLTLRLRSRVAALLATDPDPAKEIFGDVALRSRNRASLLDRTRSTPQRGLIPV